MFYTSSDTRTSSALAASSDRHHRYYQRDHKGADGKRRSRSGHQPSFTSVQQYVKVKPL